MADNHNHHHRPSHIMQAITAALETFFLMKIMEVYMFTASTTNPPRKCSLVSLLYILL